MTLLDLIDGLPTASRLTRAMMDDPEVAEQILDAEDPSAEWSPPLSEFGLAESYLAAISEKIDGLTAAVIAAAGGKPEKPAPAPRPRTALDVARERRSQQAQREVIALFAPHAVMP